MPTPQHDIVCAYDCPAAPGGGYLLSVAAMDSPGIVIGSLRAGCRGGAASLALAVARRPAHRDSDAAIGRHNPTPPDRPAAGRDTQQPLARTKPNRIHSFYPLVQFRHGGSNRAP